MYISASPVRRSSPIRDLRYVSRRRKTKKERTAEQVVSFLPILSHAAICFWGKRVLVESLREHISVHQLLTRLGTRRARLIFGHDI